MSNTRKFGGTTNPRHLRALVALLCRPMTREELDRRAGASNSPDLVAELRRRGLDIPCERVKCYDRDGRLVFKGVYSLSHRDRRLVHEWQLSSNGKKGQ